MSTRVAVDPGLAGQRTDLSWGRTLLAMIALTALFLRWLPIHGVAAALPFGLAIVGALFIVASRRNRHAQVFGADESVGTVAAEIVTLTALIVVLAAVAAVFIAVGI